MSNIDRITIHPGETFVACDGRKVLVMLNEGTAEAPILAVRCEYTRQTPRAEAFSDPTGRVVALEELRVAARRLADRDVAETTFLRCVIVGLDEAVAAGDIRSLVIAAPPQALALIHRHASPRLTAAIRTTAAADLADASAAELERLLGASPRLGLAAIA